MAKMFYTLDEAAQKLGVQQDEVMSMVASGQLSEFRDGDDLRFKVEQVDLMSSAEESIDDMIPLVDDGEESALGITLEDSANIASGSGIAIDETVVDLGATQQKEASGISIFEADEFDQADASADTIITDSPVGGDFQMESSGSGLLDLTREADDTSLGADLLEDVYSDSDDTSGSSGLFEETSAASDVSSAFPEAQGAPGGAVMAVEMVEGGASGASGGAVLGMFMVVAATLAAVLMTLVGDGTNPLMDLFQSASPLIWGAACLGVVVVFAAIGFVVGRR